MTDERLALEADLNRYQQTGDFEAQAETLLALARLAEDDEADKLAQGLYGQAWAIAQQIGHHNHVIQAMRGLGRVLTGTALREEQRAIGINLDHWFDDVLTLALKHGNRWNQAETYLAMAHWAQRLAAGTSLALHYSIWGFAIYYLMGSVPETVDTPKMLTATRPIPLRGFIPIKELLLNRHRAVGDRVAEAHALLAYGESAFWGSYSRNDKHEITRQDFEAAYALFIELGDLSRVEEVLMRLLRLARRIQDYEFYKTTHAKLVRYLLARKKFDEVITLWTELALTASDYLDWPVVRHAYQAALMTALLLHMPEKQVYIYWQWGQMEFYKTHNRVMGVALCRWSMTLRQRYLPDQMDAYARDLRQMEKEIVL